MPKTKLQNILIFSMLGAMITIAAVLLFVAQMHKRSADTHNSVGINEQINYQGRLLTNTGAVVPDGTYNIEFKIYQDGDGVLGGGDESLKWTETRTGGNKVTVKNGYFSVYLGSVTSFGTSIDWNQSVIWLSINIGGTGSPSWDGEMSPYTRFSSTPYALNSKTLNGLDSSSFVQLGQGTQTDASSNASISIDKTNSGNILELFNTGVGVFTVAGDGSTTISPVSNTPNAFQIINAATEQLLSIDTSAPDNLISNPNFEVNDTDWSGHGPGSTYQSTEQAYTGSGSLRVDASGADGGAQYNTATVGLNSNTTYSFSFYAKQDTKYPVYNFTTLNVGYSDDGASDTADCLTNQTMVSYGWTRYSCTFTTGTLSGTPYIYIKQTDATTRTFFIDGALLTSYSNLVTNSDFETNTSGWTGYSSGTISQNATQAKTGTKSLRIISSGSEGGATYNYAFQPDTEYTISMYVKLDAASTPTTYAIGKSTGSGSSSTDHAGCNIDTPSATEWKLFTCTFTTESSLRGSPYFTFNRLTSTGSTTVYIDTVSLSASKPKPTAFSLGKIVLNGIVTSPTVFQSASDSTTAFQIQNAGGSSVLVADTLNSRLAVGKPTADYTLDVDGDVNIAAGSVYRINGVDINTAGTLNNVAYLSQNNTFTGTNTFKTATNSTTAFQIQNSGSDSLLNVDNATTSNLITNPSFEVNTTGWAQRTSATLTRITSDKYVGAASMQVAASSSADTGVKYAYNLASSTQYSFSFYAKATASFTTMKVGRSDDGLTASEVNCLSGQTVSTTNWTRYTCTFTTGTTSGARYVYITHSDGTAHTYYIDGVQLEAAASATNFKLGTVGIDGIINSHVMLQNSVDSTTAFQVQNAAGTTTILNVDTINGRLGVGTATPAYALDVVGDVNIGGGNAYRIGTTSICTSSGCVVDAASGIKNQTSNQTNANFNIQSSADGSVTAALKARASQTADLLQALNSSSVKLSGIAPDGSFTANAAATGTTATTSGTGTNTTTVTLTGSAFADGDVILIDNAGQDYYTRITSGGGTSTLTVSPAVTFETGRTVTKYTIQNVGATTTDYTTTANRFFQGYFLGGVVTGAGSTTLSDGRLTSTTPMNFNSPSYSFQNTSNSTSAFQIQSSGNDQLVNVDTLTTHNLLTNGNFETNATGWAAKGAAGSPTQTTSQHYLGNGSLSFTTTAAADDGAKYNYALASQTNYTLTFYVKMASLTATNSTITIGRSENGSTDTDCATSTNVINGGGWTKVTCGFTTANVSGTDYIYIKQTDAVARTMYIDSVQLESTSSFNSNTDFEVDLSGWGGYAGPTLTQTSAQAYTGSNSLRVDTSSSSGSIEGGVINTGTVQPNTTYSASFMVRLDGATAASRTFSIVKRFDQNDGTTATCASKVITADVWTNISCTFTTGTVTSGSPYIGIVTTDAGDFTTVYTFYIDNAVVAPARWSSNDIGQIALNGSISSPLTVRGAQDSTSALQVQQQNGNGVLTVDTLNGRVGIGTDAPNKTLEVDGKALIKATGTDTDTFQVANTAAVGSSNSVAFNVAANSRTVSVGLSANTVNSILNVYGTQLINTKANSASAFRIQDSAGVTALSFATTSGNRKLQIGGTGTGNDGKLTIANSSGSSVVDIDSSSSGTVYFSADDFQINSYTSGNPMITADGTTGYVGIGQFGPSYPLDVIGDINTSTVYRVAGTSGATTTCSGGQFLQNQVVVGGITTGGTCATASGGSGVTTVGTFSGSSQTNGASISGSTITFGPADGTNPGMVTTGTQSFAGDKTFSGNVATSGSATITSAGLLTGNAGLTVSGGTATINTSANNTSIGNASSILTLTGSSSSTIVLAGTTISAAELNLLDTHNVALVDIDDGVNTAITGTGILGAGSIASGFGAIDVGADSITTSGTIGTASTTTFTGNTGTFSGAIAANGGITFDNSTDTVGAHTLAGTVDAANNLIINIGNAGTDFTSGGGLNLAGALGANGGITFDNSTDTIGAFTNAGTQDAANNLIINIGNAGTDFTAGGGLTLAGSLAANGGITFDNSTDTIGAFTLAGNQDAANNLLLNIGAAGTDFTSGGGLTLAGNLVANGTATFQSTTASSNALQVQNAAGANIVNVNTNTVANLVSNPSIESNTNGWSKKGNASVAITSSDEVATTFGSRELKIVTTANTNDGATFNFTPVASTAYSITFWAKSTGSTGANISFGHRENTGTGDVDCLTGQTLTTTWTQFTCNNFTTNATVNDTAPTVGIYVKQSDGTSRTIYIDGVTMVQATTGLTYSAGGANFDVQSLNSNVTLNTNNTGDLQPWQTNSNALNAGTALRYSSSAISNGYIYNIGGCTGACGAGTAVTTVQYAKISSTGAVGAWNTTTVLPAARYGHTSYQANGYIYVVGGDNAAGAFGATPQTTVYYAKVNNDGTVGAWQTSSRVLPAAREFHTSSFNGGFAYVIGGDNAGAQSTVYYAKMYADGSTGVWNTTTALTTGAAARRDASTVFANGYMYVIGGDTGGTAQSTVYYNSVNADGTLGATWSSTSSLTNIRRYHSSVVANGYVYAIGGDNGTTAQNTVYYAELLGDGTLGTWNSASSLPAGRYGQASGVINGYVYAIGGYDGTNAAASVFYASTARTMIGGTLDLVGLSSQYLSDPGAAGAIVAGNIRAIGGLQVEGFADINGGLSVDSALNINAVSADAGQVVFNINNFSSNSIFNVRHMGTNFGSFASGGAFEGKNSYFGEEFNVGKAATCSVSVAGANIINRWVRGDMGASATACTTAGVTTNSGELSFTSSTNGTTTFGTCSATSPGVTTANGVERITATSVATVSATAICAEVLSGTTTTSNKIYTATNLPIISMKVRPSTLAASNNNAFVVVGASTSDSAGAATATNDLPDTGLFFTNCSTYGASGAPSGCSNTNWYAMAASGGTQVGTTQSCSGTLSTAQFAYLRIEVRGTSDVHFYADVDTSNGIQEIECGTGITSAVSTSAMTPWMEAAFKTNTANTTALDIDYFRSWQDDNNGPANEDEITPPEGVQDPLSTPPLTSATSEDPGSSDSSLFSFSAATSEDTVFDHDVYVKGTLYADKIKANQIEGLEVYTDKLASLQQKLNDEAQNSQQNDSNQQNNTSNSSGGTDLNNLTIQKATVALDLGVGGGLSVGGDAQFHGNTFFYKLVTFVEKAVFKNDVTFEGRVAFNSDTAGYAVIHPGQTEVKVKFDQPYEHPPVVAVSVKSGQFVQYAYKDLSANGFTIIISQPATEDIEFSWVAVSVNGVKTAELPLSP